MSDDTLPPTRLPPMRIADRHMVHDGFVTLEVVVLDTEVRGETARIRREIHDHGDGAAVLAFDPEARTAVLVRQVRAAALVADGTGITVEAIAGLVDGVEDPEHTVRREAMEEAGVTLGSVEFLGAPYASPGAVTERIWLYLGEIDVSVPREAGGGVVGEHEEIEVLDVPLATLAALADRGGIGDLKTLTLIEALRRRRPDLFA
jgi:nudix-type nucleoside diphosphatase (YffH/AdpP family)